MHDLIICQHKLMSPPSTYNRNQNRTPINALWGSMSLDVERSGYRPFDQELPSAPSDGHRLIWVEVNNLSSLGKDVPHSSKAINATRLKSRNPLIRNRYNKMVKKEYRKQNIFRQARNLEQMKQNYMKRRFDGDPDSYYNKFVHQFNTYHKALQKIREDCAQTVSTLFAGEYDWSPRFQKLGNKVEFWR